MTTIVGLIPFVLAGAFVPTWTSRVIIFLGTERPIRISVAYIAGNASWRLLLGTAVLLSFEVRAPEVGAATEMPPQVAALLAVLAGVGGAWILLARPKEPPGTRSLPRWMQAYRSIPAWATFSLGFISCASPGIQWAYFLGGMGVIVTSGLDLAAQFILMVGFVVLLESMLIAPLVAFVLYREQATSRLEQLEFWVARNGSAILGTMLVALSLLLTYVALTGGPPRA